VAPEQLVLVGARAALDEHDLEVVPAVGSFPYELEELAVGAATRSLLLRVVEAALAGRDLYCSVLKKMKCTQRNFISRTS
jgi:hypothetical protein